MPIVSLIAASLMAMLVIYAAVGISVAIYRNLRRGLTYRLTLGSELGELRLSKVLGRLDVRRDHYLHNLKVTEINQQMNRCGACQKHVECDQTLGSASWRDIAVFCPNYPDLAELPQRLNGR